MNNGRTGLLDLPAELLFEILAYSTSSDIPLVNKYLLHTFHGAPPSCRAYFILGKLDPSVPLVPSIILESALSYPICTENVLDFLEHMHPLVLLPRSSLKDVRVSPGRWVFRNLQSHPKPKRRRKHPNSAPAPSSSLNTNLRINPLTFLESLERMYTLSFSAPGSAFALAMCVRAGPAQYPLLQLLLRNGDLNALKLMIEPTTEPSPQGTTGGKRRRMEDRVQPTTNVLSAAVKEKHLEVAEWLMHEKGVVPDMATMRMLQT
ncbi:hypothetical protein ACGC1H_002878 [Rhizoctonia solani]